MTELTILQQKILDAQVSCPYRFSEPMHRHTSFRIGGGAEVMAFPQNREQLLEIIQLSRLLDTKIRILGAGTNVLAPDEGVCGIVICLKDGFVGKSLLTEDRIVCMAGETMTKAAVFAANARLSGMEFAHGIPGTIGGGVYMNAGAYGAEIRDICESVEVLFENGEIKNVPAEQMEFSYRHSILEETGGLVISATFRLRKEQPEAIKAKMKELMARRSASQPLDLPSAGSAFKRPQGGYAAALIDQSGLKGFRVGDATISTKHAGFAVNLGNATASDVRSLLQQVSDIVFEKTKIRLEPEVRIW